MSKRLCKDLKKVLKTPKSSISLKEHNTFLFLTADRPEKKPINPKVIEETQGKLYLRFQEYYKKNKSRLEKELKGKRELKETSQIVRNFLKEIDPKLEKSFDLQLKKRISELPTEFFNVQTNSLTAIWKLSEEPKVQLYLSGCPNKIFKASQVPEDVELEAMVDKIAFLNFFITFLKPTLFRLREISKLLETLRLGLSGAHYTSGDYGIQTKLEMFLRILSAKLSSLQNMDKTTSEHI